MRRLVTWLLVTLGIAALVRRLRKREEPEWSPAPSATTPEGFTAPETVSEPVAPAPESPRAPGEPTAEDDPAAELRERLARSRAEIPTDEDSVEERRASVHEQGRAALDEMQPQEEEEAESADEEQ